MPQDKDAQHRYEQAAAAAKSTREDDSIDSELNADYLKADSHNGQQGVLPVNAEALEASEVKEVYSLLEDFTHDELRRVRVLGAGASLIVGDAYVSLHDRQRGEVRPTEEETVGEGQYFVAKKDVDFQIWDKLTYQQR